MGAFILGVLVGWLAEWLFYTFWVKAGDNQADCSALQAELDLKNRQITSLQSQLASASEGSTNKASSNTKTAAVKSATKTTSNKAAKKTTSNSSNAKTAAKSKAKASNDAKSTTNKTTAAKSTTNKTTAAKATTSKATTAKAASAKSSTAKSSTAKSSTAKSPVAKMKTTAAKAGGDDFTKLSGIGPSMSATLKSLGIDTFSKLAATDDDILRDMLEQSGAKMNNNKDVMDSWNEQATVAATGDFKALKAMQAALKR